MVAVGLTALLCYRYFCLFSLRQKIGFVEVITIGDQKVLENNRVT